MPKSHRIVWLLIAMLGLGFSLHMLLSHRAAAADSRQNAADVFDPQPGPGDVSETGYIYKSDHKFVLREGKESKQWFVNISGTDHYYVCSYQSGFDGFRTGDSVRIIHDKGDRQSGSSYLVGINDPRRGKAAMISARRDDDAGMGPDADMP